MRNRLKKINKTTLFVLLFLFFGVIKGQAQLPDGRAGIMCGDRFGSETFKKLLAEQLELKGLVSESFRLKDPKTYFFKKHIVNDLFPDSAVKTETAVFFEFCRSNRINRIVHDEGTTQTVSYFDFSNNRQTDSIFKIVLQMEKQDATPRTFISARTESIAIRNEPKQPYRSLAWFLYHPEVWLDKSELSGRFAVAAENADRQTYILSEARVNLKPVKQAARKRCFAKNKTDAEFHYRYQYGKRVGNTIMTVRVDSSNLVCFRTFIRYTLNKGGQVESIQVLRTDKKERLFAENLSFTVPVSDSIVTGWKGDELASGTVYRRNTDIANQEIEKKYAIQITSANDQVIINEDGSGDMRMYVFDKTGRLISFRSDKTSREFLYNKEGQIMSVSEDAGSPDKTNILRFTYNDKKTETIKRSYAEACRPVENKIIVGVNESLPPGLFDSEGNLNEWIVNYDQTGRIVQLRHQRLDPVASAGNNTYWYKERNYSFQYDQKGLPVLPGWKIFYNK